MEFGIQAVISILLSLIFIALSWFALQTFKFDLFLHRPDGWQAKTLMILLSIVIGHGVANFFLDYLGWSLMLRSFFAG
ncbi:MAG: DUF1146 domain-containing protein [Bacillaceae bacterium]|nr:DUF1146 domain-containing protein [Bacillaceae bacterium]